MSVRQIEPHSAKWERLANRVARDFAPHIYPCAKCAHPVVYGYCCTFCGDANPSESPNRDAPKEDGR